MPDTTTAVILDLLPLSYTVKVTRRDSFTFGWTLEDDSGLIDFSGDAMLLTVNTQVDGLGTDLFAIAQSNTLGADGLVEFRPSIVNHTQDADTYFYDIQWTASGGDVRTIFKGEYIIGDDISD